MQPTVSVLLIDPDPAGRQRLQGLLEAGRDLQVAGAAASAEQAVAMAARRPPDVILLVHGRPGTATITQARDLMQARATPLVVLAPPALPVSDDLAFALMEAGVLAVVRDPASGTGPAAAAEQLRATLRLMSEVKVVRRWSSLRPPAAAAAPARTVPGRQPPRINPADLRRRIELVAIGASTGGPVALKQLLCRLPGDFPVPIVIVQHMADGFLEGMASWLRASCAVPTEIATPTSVLRPGHAYLAPDGMHLRVTAERRLALEAGPPIHGHRPAVGILFASVAEHFGRQSVGILLTGMGKDGSAELKAMKDAGSITIAQDEASCVVYGMPGEAVRCGGATYVMTPEEIGAVLPALAQRGREQA